MDSYIGNEPQKHIYMGSFNAEFFWREDKLAKLPVMPDEQADNIVLAMDELQFAFCKTDDLLLTRYTMDESHMDYLKDIGFNFLNNQIDLDSRMAIDKASKKKSVFELLQQVNNKACYKSLMKSGYCISPFACIPCVDSIADDYNLFLDSPPPEVVKRVNSKVYSTLLKDRLGIMNISRIAEGTSELYDMGMSFLKYTPFIIKDEYGVSGKGNILVQSEAILKRIINYLSGQEKKGSIVRFVIEPLLDKAEDFSCQFFTDSLGCFHILSVQKVLNSGFSYNGSIAIDDALKELLHKNRYWELMERISQELYADGYYGHVCIDSMILKNGEMEPVVEINARKSMSLVKHYVDRYLCSHSVEGIFTNISVVFNNMVEFEELLVKMRARNLLYCPGSKSGIIPLSANTLLINRDADNSCGSGNVYKGKFYFSSVSQFTEEINDITRSLKAFMEECGFKVQG